MGDICNKIAYFQVILKIWVKESIVQKIMMMGKCLGTKTNDQNYSSTVLYSFTVLSTYHGVSSLKWIWACYIAGVAKLA